MSLTTLATTQANTRDKISVSYCVTARRGHITWLGSPRDTRISILQELGVTEELQPFFALFSGTSSRSARLKSGQNTDGPDWLSLAQTFQSQSGICQKDRPGVALTFSWSLIRVPSQMTLLPEMEARERDSEGRVALLCMLKPTN